MLCSGCKDLPSVGKSSNTFVSHRTVCILVIVTEYINQGVFSSTTKISLLHQGLCTVLDVQLRLTLINRDRSSQIGFVIDEQWSGSTEQSAIFPPMRAGLGMPRAFRFQVQPV
ncbi:hypothetical protein QLX08_007099 [Tetragonisca angustula]|uniref:Uncharacterized protein n=1 Tax=Tetragonisca angustula TaxID=166442 RepID=A0AAW0ZRR7_9HYME